MINNCSLYIEWKTFDLNIAYANYLVIVIENGKERINTHIPSSKYVLDAILSAATYKVRVVCKGNSTDSQETLRGNILAFPSNATLFLIIKDKFNKCVI